MGEPKLQIIQQAGMGVGVSGWPLANAVSKAGQLGVVSGVILDVVFVRRLQDGDLGGHLREAANEFPYPGVAKKVVDKYYIPGGKGQAESYKQVPMHTLIPNKELHQLGAVAGFCEVWLAKRGHDNPVGMNVMQKLDITNLAIIYGAMLAGLDRLIMGAGIPFSISKVLNGLVKGESVFLSTAVLGASADDDFKICFDPSTIGKTQELKLKRPDFYPIVASNVLAKMFITKTDWGPVEGFVVECPVAGGHNAPPRKDLGLKDGQPIYGPKDEVNFEKIAALEKFFYLAGGQASYGSLQKARDFGAAGVQIGTAFAFCAESGLVRRIKDQAIQKGELEVFTDPIASPTGFPFKVLKLEGSLSEKDVYDARPRKCDLGYLRQLYKKDDGSVGYRCSAEPVDDYVRKGGDFKETVGRKCLCNGLMANIGHSQVRRGDGYIEPPVVTSGDDTGVVSELVKRSGPHYSAEDVISYMLSK